MHRQGRIFLDRCGQLFAEVLSLLRGGPEWRPPEDRCAWRPVGAMYVGWGCGLGAGWSMVLLILLLCGSRCGSGERRGGVLLLLLLCAPTWPTIGR